MIKMSKYFVTEHNPGFCRIIQYHISVWWVGWSNSRVLGVMFCCFKKGSGLLCVGRGGVLWMPPVHEPHTLYRIQHHLGPALIPPLLPPLQWRVLEQQANTVVAHVCANVDCEQCQCHAHDYRDEDEVEGGDLKHVAVRVWVHVDIFILSGQMQGLGTTIFIVSLLLYKLEVELPQCLWPSPCHLSHPEQ